MTRVPPIKPPLLRRRDRVSREFGRVSRVLEELGRESEKFNGGKELTAAAEIPELFKNSRNARDESAKSLTAKRFRGFHEQLPKRRAFLSNAALSAPQPRQPIDLAPEARDRLVDDLLHRLDLVDQARAFAGRARGVVDVALDIEHVERGVARQALALAFVHLHGIGRAQAARAGARRAVRINVAPR